MDAAFGSVAPGYRPRCSSASSGCVPLGASGGRARSAGVRAPRQLPPSPCADPAASEASSPPSQSRPPATVGGSAWATPAIWLDRGPLRRGKSLSNHSWGESQDGAEKLGRSILALECVAISSEITCSRVPSEAGRLLDPPTPFWSHRKRVSKRMIRPPSSSVKTFSPRPFPPGIAGE